SQQELFPIEDCPKFCLARAQTQTARKEFYHFFLVEEVTWEKFPLLKMAGLKLQQRGSKIESDS
ncbi:unnamed protein product, partial [Larinioides sclopetarius]